MSERGWYAMGSIQEAERHPRTIGSERRRALILRDLQRGYIPLAVADRNRCSDALVAEVLRDGIAAGQLEPVPSFLSMEGPKREPRCEKCGR
jgi:hypothetical protein